MPLCDRRVRCVIAVAASPFSPTNTVKLSRPATPSGSSVAEAEEAVRLLAATPLGSANRALHVTNAGLA
jgi:hypothetical protein